MVWRVALCVAFLSILATLVVRWSQSDRLQKLSDESIQSAWDRWRAAKIEDYRLRLKQEGRWSHELEVEVAGGRMVGAKRDGAELPPHRLPRAWTIDGMFDTLMTDAQLNEAAERGDADGRFIRMLGNLAEDTGIPQRYLRIEMAQRGGNSTAGWEVLEFTPTDAPQARVE